MSLSWHLMSETLPRAGIAGRYRLDFSHLLPAGWSQVMGSSTLLMHSDFL